MNIHGVECQRLSTLCDLNGIVSFAKDDNGHWCVRGHLGAPHTALQACGLHGTPTDLPLRELVKLAHELTGSSLRLTRMSATYSIHLPIDGYWIAIERNETSRRWHVWHAYQHCPNEQWQQFVQSSYPTLRAAVAAYQQAIPYFVEAVSAQEAPVTYSLHTSSGR